MALTRRLSQQQKKDYSNPTDSFLIVAHRCNGRVVAFVRHRRPTSSLLSSLSTMLRSVDCDACIVIVFILVGDFVLLLVVVFPGLVVIVVSTGFVVVVDVFFIVGGSSSL